MKKLFMAVAIPTLLVGCNKGQKHILNRNGEGSLFQLWTQDTNSISIKTFDDQPIANAQILIGDSLDTPFTGNFLTADSNGQIQIPAEWTTAQSITVQAPGYIRSTYIAQEPGTLIIKLRPQLQQTSYEVRGNISGLPIEDKDGIVDFGLVMSAFTKLDMLSFNINNVISPQNDRIKTLGQDVDIPANISLPHQSEKYSLLTVTLDKPIYRVYHGQPGINRVFAARGRFPFKSTVDALRGGSEFYELVNDFRINGGTIRDIDVKQGENRLNIPIRELNFTEKKKVNAPTLRGDEIFLAVGVVNQSGYMIPTDVKKLEPNQNLSLNTLPNSEQRLLGVLKKTDEMKSGKDRMSITLVPFTAEIKPSMLPLIPDPTFAADDEILIPKPSEMIEGVNPIATYSVLCEEQELQQGPTKVKLYQSKWEVYTQNWPNTLKIPQWPNDSVRQGKKRWEVNLVGSQTASQAPIGPAMIETATHVTHSSISF